MNHHARPSMACTATRRALGETHPSELSYTSPAAVVNISERTYRMQAASSRRRLPLVRRVSLPRRGASVSRRGPARNPVSSSPRSNADEWLHIAPQFLFHTTTPISLPLRTRLRPLNAERFTAEGWQERARLSSKVRTSFSGERARRSPLFCESVAGLSSLRECLLSTSPATSASSRFSS